jgi:hypothetical protein
MSLPYHELRKPAHLQRAGTPEPQRAHARPEAGSARAPRRLLALRVVPLGIRARSQTHALRSLRSHDDHRAGVFNHVTLRHLDVVWHGVDSARASSIEGHRARGAPGGLANQPRGYARLRGQDRRSLLVFARYDLTFPTGSRSSSRISTGTCAHDQILPCGTTRRLDSLQHPVQTGRFVSGGRAEQG